MTNMKIAKDRININKICFEQLTELIKDIKHCSNLLSKACDRSLHQCEKITDEKEEKTQ